VNATTEPPFEPVFLDEPPLAAGFLQECKSEHDVPFFVDVPFPDSIPEDTASREIDLAERILSAGGTGTRTAPTHHEEIRKSMTEWAPDHGEDVDGDPGYWRRMVLSLSPRERNFGTLRGEHEEQLQKARTILAWAADTISQDILKEIEREQAESIKQECREAAKEVKAKRERKAFREDPPESVNGWGRVSVENENVQLAYQAENHGTPVIAVVYDQPDGGLDAREFTLENWVASRRNPHETRTNRHLVSAEGDTAFDRLYSHVHTFDVDPLSASTVEA